MDFQWSEEQLEYRESIIAFAHRYLNEGMIERDRDGVFSKDLWKKCAEVGIQGLPVPESYGGQGADALTVMVAMEALGYGCRDNGLIFSLNAHIWSSIMPIVRFGNEAQKRRYLPGLCDGSLIGVQGMTEPQSGSDAFSLATTAERRDDQYVLNGSKTFITNAPIADLFVIFARTSPTGGALGLSAFIVESDTPGLDVGKPFKKMGLRTSPMSELFFTDCAIPADNLLGRSGAGMVTFNHSIDWERCCILASAVGTMERELEACIEYAKVRKQFGRPIGDFQAVSHRIVAMKLGLETARLVLYRAGWAKFRKNGEPTPLDSAMAKLVVSETWVKNSLDALQIYGGYGYTTEYEVERQVRDAIASRIYSGTSDIQKNIIAHALGL